MPTAYPVDTRTNVLVLDDQHEVLHDCIRKLEEGMAKGDGARLVPEILATLSKFPEYHFGTEERLMQSFGYPLRDMHGLEHGKARLILQQLAAREDSIGIAGDLLHELQE